MELRVLKYFLMVAREENITRAAQLLHVTQPTLSRQLMQLEEELGVSLFRRSNHNIILTEDGMLLKRRAQEIVDLAEKTRRDLAQREKDIAGEISVGSGEAQSVACFGKILAAFREKHPLVRYQMFSGNADNIKDRIESGLLDMGLLMEPVDIGKYEFVRMPVREEWGVLVREDSPLAAQEAVTPGDLVGIPLMMSGRALVRNELANWFGDAYERLDILMSYNLLYNVAVLVQQGIGAALCLRLDSRYDHLRFVPLSPRLEIGSVLAWKKNQIYSPATSAFIEFAKAYLRGIAGDSI